MVAGGPARQNGGMPEVADMIHVAGVVVRVSAPAVRTVLEAVPGVAVHGADRDGRSLVVTIDGATAEGLRATHDAIVHTPGVVAAQLVCHLADEDDAPAEAGV